MFLHGPPQRDFVLLTPVGLQQLFTPSYLTPHLPSTLYQPSSFKLHHVVMKELLLHPPPETHFLLFILAFAFVVHPLRSCGVDCDVLML